MHDKVAKAKLLLTTVSDVSFFGINIAKFDVDIRKLPPGIGGFVQFKKDKPNEPLTNTIVFAESLISKDDFDYKHTATILVHEIAHVLGKHGLRGQKKQYPILWNLACDHVVNAMIEEIISRRGCLRFYGDHYVLFDDIPKNITAEEVYDMLLKEQQKMQQRFQITKISGDNGSSDPNAPDVYKVTDTKTGKKYEVKIPKMTPEMQEGEENTSSSAKPVYEVLKQRGTMPGYLTSILDKMLEVKIPWQDILIKAIRTNIQLIINDRGWKSLNKRFIPHGITLPGDVYGEEKNAIGTLHVLVDTSASISDDELAKFANVIIQAFDKFEEIVVIQHDHEIQGEIMRFDSDEPHKFESHVRNKGFKGRGGTSHREAFDYLEREYENDVDSMSMVISLTDFESDIQHIYENYKFIKNNIPVVFIITEREYGGFVNLPELNYNTMFIKIED